MKNFGEIIINPRAEKPKLPITENIKNNPNKKIAQINNLPENISERKRRTIEYIKQFDQAHANKELTPQEKKSRNKKIYIGLAVASLAIGAYDTNTEEKIILKNPQTESTPYSTNNSSREIQNIAIPISEKNTISQEVQKEIPPSKIIENKKLEEKKELEIPPKERLEKVHNLSIEIQALSRNLLKNNDFFPKKIFSDDFLLAIQAQESGFDKGAQSHKGAVGSMQVMPETIKETLLYINKIDPRLNFEEKNITKELISDLTYLIKQNPELGKAFGNLYLAEIFNNFDIGKKSLEMNWTNLGRKKILAVYNWGISKFMRNATNEDNWPAETKNYIENISADKKIFDKINSQLGIDENNKVLKIEKNKNIKTEQPKFISLKTNPKLIKETIILELRKFREDKNIDYSKIDIDEIINYYLGEIKIKEKIDKNFIKREALEKLIKNLNYKIFKNFVAEKGLIKPKEKSPV